MDSRRLVALALQVLMVAWTSPAWGQQFPNGTLLLLPQNGPFNPVESLREGLGINLAALPDDRVFFADVNIGPKCRSDGPITIELPATRYVGSLTSQDFLANASDMVQRGLLSPTATLVIAAYDIDSNSGPTLTWDLPRPPEVEIIPPEDDLVTFNGKMPAGGSILSEPSLLGENEKWSLTAHDVDIRNVKFPEKGANGVEPTPAINTIKIEIDTIGEFHPLFCIGGIDWVALHFKTVSPIIMVHGNDSESDFWNRQGFVSHLAELPWPGYEGCGICESPIQLPTGPMDANAKALADIIPAIARTLGVNSVHLVAHSKGGLDTRRYLEVFQQGFDDEFKVLSFSTLSTPHNGSVGADVQIAYRGALRTGVREPKFSGFPEFTDFVAEILPANEGTPFLTTASASRFNSDNLPDLPKTTVYHTVGADADEDVGVAAGTIDDTAEYDGFTRESWALWGLTAVLQDSVVTERVNALYQTLRNVGMVEIRLERRSGLLAPLRYIVVGVEIVAVEAPGGPHQNDLMVTVDSAHGRGTFEALVPPSSRLTFNGVEGRDHATVVDSGVAKRLVPMLRKVDREHDDGDLQD